MPVNFATVALVKYNVVGAQFALASFVLSVVGSLIHAHFEAARSWPELSQTLFALNTLFWALAAYLTPTFLGGWRKPSNLCSADRVALATSLLPGGRGAVTG